MDEQTIDKIKKWLKIESELKLLALEAKKRKQEVTKYENKVSDIISKKVSSDRLKLTKEQMEMLGIH